MIIPDLHPATLPSLFQTQPKILQTINGPIKYICFIFEEEKQRVQYKVMQKHIQRGVKSHQTHQLIQISKKENVTITAKKILFFFFFISNTQPRHFGVFFLAMFTGSWAEDYIYIDRERSLCRQMRLSN